MQIEEMLKVLELSSEIKTTFPDLETELNVVCSRISEHLKLQEIENAIALNSLLKKSEHLHAVHLVRTLFGFRLYDSKILVDYIFKNNNLL